VGDATARADGPDLAPGAGTSGVGPGSGAR